MKRTSRTAQQTEDILDSLEGVKRADAPPYLWSKVRNRLQPSEAARPRWVPQLVALMAVFLLLNIWTLYQRRSTVHAPSAQTPAGSGTQAVASEYSISLPQTY